MRVVDDHAERLPASTDSKRPGTPATDSTPAPDRVLVDAERARRGDRARRVRPVEAAAQAQAGRRARRPAENVDRAGQLGCQAPPPLVVDVDDRDVGLVEERALRREVLIHRAVEVEVVLRQVREDEHAEARAGEPSLRAADRRRLHRARTVAGVEHLAEQALEVDRLGRVQPDRPLLPADDAPRCS